MFIQLVFEKRAVWKNSLHGARVTGREPKKGLLRMQQPLFLYSALNHLS